MEMLDYLDLNRTLNYINKRVDDQLELEDILSLIRQKYLPTVFFYDGELTVKGTSATYDFCTYSFIGYIYPPSHTYLLQGADTVINDGYCYEVITSAKLQTNMLNTTHAYKPSLEEQDFIKFNPAYSVDGKDICIPKVAIDAWLNKVNDADQSNSHEDSQTAGLHTDKKTEQLGENQRRLVNYELFTAHHIACLLSDHSPVGEDHNNDDDYKLYKEMVDIAIDACALNVFNDKGQIASGEVKVWLARRDFIYKGFNDNLVEYLDYEDDPLKELTDELLGIISVVSEDNTKKDEEIEQLAADYEELRLEHEELLRQNKYICEDLAKDKQGNNEDLSQHLEAESKKYQAEIIDLKQQLKGRMEKPVDDPSIKVHYKSLKTVDRIMYAMAELTGFDNSHPTSQNMPSLNAQITTVLLSDGLPLEYEAVGKWLKRVNELKSKNKLKE